MTPSSRIGNEAYTSGVSWAAVTAGAFATAALSLTLLALGAGFGLSSVSPWSNAGSSASAVGTGAIVWLIVMEILSASLGGYLAGRLRTKWAGIHTDEVYFRDTAHGFLAWAVALVITAAFLASAAAAMVGAGRTAPEAGHSEWSADQYLVDSIFRSDAPRPDAAGAALRGEAGRILANSVRRGQMPAADQTYLNGLVAAHTGLTSADADKRVSSVFTDAQQLADTARRAIAHSLLWTFVALLTGAFCASVAATLGGRQRDHVVTI